MEASRTAANYMSGSLVVLRPDLGIHQAMRILLEHDISGAPVVDDGGELVGILTEKDCFRAAVQESYNRDRAGPVADYMSQPVKTIDGNTDIVTVIEIFFRSHHRRFPVVMDNELVGQLSRKDVLKAVEELW